MGRGLKVGLLVLVWALPGAALAHGEDVETVEDEGGEAGEDSGYRDVDLVDGGRTKMEDKRDYTMALVPGLSIIPPGFKVRFQYGMSDRLTLIAGAGYAGFGYKRESSIDVDDDDTSELTSSSETDWTRYHVLAGLDFQPIGNGMHGFYVGPRVLYRKGDTNFSLFENDAQVVRNIVVARVLMGYSVVMDPGILMKVGVGAGYRIAVGSIVSEYVTSESSYSGFTPTVEMNLGWAF